MPTPLIIIPARMASTRLPGKPLVDIHGQPMIVRAWHQAEQFSVGPVVVACADEVIASTIRKAGGTAVLTRQDHHSGSDRVYEAVQIVDPVQHYNIVINVQGDLLALESKVLKMVLTVIDSDPLLDVVTPVSLMTNINKIEDRNVVKVAVGFTAFDHPGSAARVLYFSRTAIPGCGNTNGPFFHHIGLYAYRRISLARLATFPQSVLEKREQLEQLRALENGMYIKAVLTDSKSLEINSSEDLKQVRSVLSL